MTSRAAWGIDDDMPILTRALDELGVPWSEVAWDDEAVSADDWARFPLVVVRSTWDYHRRLDEFLHWVDRVDARTVMANPPPILRWNVDKHYLRDLQAAGLPCVPTCFAEPGPDDDWREELRVLLEKGPVVVKPAISAGSNDTERHDAFAGARAHVSSLLALGRSTMIQPYVRRVDVDDETGLVFLGGRFSHAFAKGALLTDTKDVAGGLFARERIEPRIADGSQLDIGRRAMGWLTSRFGDVLYARIDLLPGDSGPMIVEAELTEPSLFLGTDPSAAANAARAIAHALNESSGGRSR